MPQRALLITLFALTVAACAGKPFTTVSLQPNAAPGTRMAVLPVNYVEKPSIEVVDNIVGFAGTAGKIAVIKGRDTKRRKFHEALSELDFDYRSYADEVLTAALREAGWQAETVDFRRTIDNILEEVPPGRFEKRPQPIDGYDVILDVYVSWVGYAAPRLGNDYQPTYHVGARLLDASSLATLYQAEVQYHPFDPEGHEQIIEPAAGSAFASFDAIMADVPAARDRLVAAIDAVLGTVAGDLHIPEG